MSARLRIRSSIVMAMALVALVVTSPASAVAPQLVIDGGTKVTLSASTSLVVQGDVLATGTLAPGPGSTLVLAGYGSPALVGVSSLAGLKLSLHGTASIAQPTTLSETLTLSSGWLSLGGHDLVAPVVAGGSLASFVVTPDTLGRVVRAVNAGTNTIFPIGNSHYDPVSLRTQIGTDNFRVAVLDAPPTTGITPSTALTRAWAITQSSPGSTGPAHASIQWNVNEQGAQFDRTIGQATSAIAFRWLSGTWVAQPGVRLTDNGLDPAIDSLSITAPGLWTLAGPAGALAVDPPGSGIPATVQLATPEPHPLRFAGAVRYALPREAEVTLALYDVTGARRVVLASGPTAAGWHVARLDASRVPAGVYFLRLDAGRDVRTTRCVVLR
jgi:hypothetical protein